MYMYNIHLLSVIHVPTFVYMSVCRERLGQSALSTIGTTMTRLWYRMLTEPSLGIGLSLSLSLSLSPPSHSSFPPQHTHPQIWCCWSSSSFSWSWLDTERSGMYMYTHVHCVQHYESNCVASNYWILLHVHVHVGWAVQFCGEKWL